MTVGCLTVDAAGNTPMKAPRSIAGHAHRIVMSIVLPFSTEIPRPMRDNPAA